MSKAIRLGLILLFLALTLPAATEAATITCPTISPFDRQMTVTNVIGCVYMGPVNGTPQAGDVSTAFTGTWTNAGLLTSDGTDNWLTADVTSGSWGSIPVAGTWNVDPAVWTAVSRAVLTFHLGNGAGNPDWFFFELAPGVTSGTFNILKISGSGGGFSNLFLWTSDPCQGNCTTTTMQTPEPGTLVLFGGGLTLVAIALRRRTKK